MAESIVSKEKKKFIRKCEATENKIIKKVQKVRNDPGQLKFK